VAVATKLREAKRLKVPRANSSQSRQENAEAIICGTNRKKIGPSEGKANGK